MSLPIPKPGLVIRYSFLWSDEKAKGAAEGSKDRPCAIVVATRLNGDGDIVTIVAPITHQPPDDPTASIEIPAATCKSLGPDSGRHWLRLDELNRFAWPGFDLRPIPGEAGQYEYGCCHPDSSSNCGTASWRDKRRVRGGLLRVMRVNMTIEVD